jgi:hypothetical protein
VKVLTLTPELEAVAKRVIWFEPPEEAIAITSRFVTYAMTYGNDADMKIVRQQLSDDDLREALANAAPGIFDERSWAYWNLKLGRTPVPPMPERVIPDTYVGGNQVDDK